MLRSLMTVSALALAFASPTLAQQSTESMPGMTADPGVAPMRNVSASDYIKLAADSDMYEMQSSRLALSRSQRDDVKNYAREMMSDHMMTTKSLMAALKNKDGTVARPSTTLSPENAAKIDLLEKAPRASFDNLYLQQQVQAHQTAWALHKGYAQDGTDSALKQVASTAVPVIERHLGHAKQLLPAGPAAAR